MTEIPNRHSVNGRKKFLQSALSGHSARPTQTNSSAHSARTSQTNSSAHSARTQQTLPNSSSARPTFPSRPTSQSARPTSQQTNAQKPLNNRPNQIANQAKLQKPKKSLFKNATIKSVTIASIFVLIIVLGIVFWRQSVANDRAKTAESEKQAQINQQKIELEKLKCTKNDVRVELISDEAKYNYENGLTLKVRYSYLGTESCKMSVADKNVYYIVTSGPQTIYNSENCKAQTDEDAGFLFGPGDTIEKEFKWNLRGAGKDSCATGALQPEGYYHIKLVYRSVDGLESTDGVFRIG